MTRNFDNQNVAEALYGCLMIACHILAGEEYNDVSTLDLDSIKEEADDGQYEFIEEVLKRSFRLRKQEDDGSESIVHLFHYLMETYNRIHEQFKEDNERVTEMRADAIVRAVMELLGGMDGNESRIHFLAIIVGHLIETTGAEVKNFDELEKEVFELFVRHTSAGDNLIQIKKAIKGN